MSIFDTSEPCSILIYGMPGSGKTNYVSYFLNTIPYQHLFIITSSDDQFEKYKGKNTTIDFEYDIEKIDNFISKKGIKILVLDDFLHLEFRGNTAKSLRKVLSTTRHTQTFIISATQLLTTIGKSFKFCSKIFLAGQLDDDSIPLISTHSKISKMDLKDISLNQYEFILSQNGQVPKKIKLKLQQ